MRITDNKLKLPWKKAGGDKKGQMTSHTGSNKQGKGLIYKNIETAKTKIYQDFRGSLPKTNGILKVDFVGESSLTVQVLALFEQNIII